MMAGWNIGVYFFGGRWGKQYFDKDNDGNNDDNDSINRYWGNDGNDGADGDDGDDGDDHLPLGRLGHVLPSLHSTSWQVPS